MSDITVAELHEPGEHRAACELFVDIWGRAQGDPPLAPELVRAIGHAGGYVAAAYAGDRMVGASVGFLGRTDGELVLHSHITGIAPDAQGQGIGAALKAHQKAWALEHDIDAITWTFDPLVRRNGHFNLQTLGARAVAYMPDFYGSLADALNGADPTDRCLVRWDVHRRAAPVEPDLAALMERGADTALAPDDNGGPKPQATRAAIRLCWVPEDIVALRAQDPVTATAWRLALREAMGTAMDDGLIGVGVSRDGWYVLTEKDDAA